jgi:hypothetical protein
MEAAVHAKHGRASWDVFNGWDRSAERKKAWRRPGSGCRRVHPPPTPVPGPPENQGWKRKFLAVNLSGTRNNDA